MRAFAAIVLSVVACAPTQRRAVPARADPICEDVLPAAPSPPPAAIPFDDRMTHPRKLSGPDPRYTVEALANRVQGTMLLTCRVTLEGCVTDCRVLQSLPHMDDAVVDALRRRRYAPATLDGKPLEVEYTFKITMRAMF